MNGKSCPCGSKPQEEKTTGGKTYEWSQLGPVAPLLDPKLYPAKLAPRPVIQVPKFDYSKEYLKKLGEKYPQLCGILQTSTPDELFFRVDSDRLKTTYQQDFGDSARGNFTLEDCLLAVEKKGQSKDSKELTFQSKKFDKLPPKSIESRKERNGDSSDSRVEKSAEKIEDDMDTPLPAWKSEYQTVIAKTGEAILKHRMHYRKEKKRKTSSA